MSKRLFLQAVKDAGLDNDDNGYIRVVDIVPDTTDVDDILPMVEEYLDENCSNGHYSRWTSFGNDLYNDAVALVNCYRKRFQSL